MEGNSSGVPGFGVSKGGTLTTCGCWLPKLAGGSVELDGVAVDGETGLILIPVACWVLMVTGGRVLGIGGGSFCVWAGGI